MYTNLAGAINPVGFLGKKNFFTFINNITKITETYIGTKKSNWLKCLNIYYSLCRINQEKITQLRD